MKKYEFLTVFKGFFGKYTDLKRLKVFKREINIFLVVLGFASNFYTFKPMFAV